MDEKGNLAIFWRIQCKKSLFCFGLSTFIVGGFFMSEKTQKKETNVFLARLIFSPMLLKSGRARKVAYVAISVALSVVCNMFFEF